MGGLLVEEPHAGVRTALDFVMVLLLLASHSNVEGVFDRSETLIMDGGLMTSGKVQLRTRSISLGSTSGGRKSRHRSQCRAEMALERTARYDFNRRTYLFEPGLSRGCTDFPQYPELLPVFFVISFPSRSSSRNGRSPFPTLGICDSFSRAAIGALVEKAALKARLDGARRQHIDERAYLLARGFKEVAVATTSSPESPFGAYFGRWVIFGETQSSKSSASSPTTTLGSRRCWSSPVAMTSGGESLPMGDTRVLAPARTSPSASTCDALVGSGTVVEGINTSSSS
jgi:hypothetical protein